MASKGRGQLSSIELLPEEAAPVVAWAAEELGQRERTQTDILEEFNERLAEIDLGPISPSAFNRHSMRLAQMARRHADVHQITTALTARMEPGQSDDLTIMAAETIKMLVFELMQDEGAIEPKGAMELARALQSAVAAQNASMARKRVQQEEIKEQVDEAIETVAAETGMSADRIDELKRNFLGLKQ